MTLAQLHNTPDFKKLKDDPRFIALLTYAYSNPSAATKVQPSLEHKAGEFQGWHNCLKALENTFEITQDGGGRTEPNRVPYAAPAEPNKESTK